MNIGMMPGAAVTLFDYQKKKIAEMLALTQSSSNNKKRQAHPDALLCEKNKLFKPLLVGILVIL